MSGFWRDIASTCFWHAGSAWLESQEQENQYLRDRIDYLEVQLTSAQNDVEALNNLYTRIDEATNDIAGKLRSLQEHLETGNVSAADVAARLTPLVARLESMGQDSQVDPNTDPTTTTDPTNSPNADSPLVNPAPDAPTDEPTNDPTVNPVDIPADSLPQDGEAGSGSVQSDNSSVNESSSVNSDSSSSNQNSGGFSSSPTTSSNEDF